MHSAHDGQRLLVSFLVLFGMKKSLFEHIEEVCLRAALTMDFK
jgi:hypothetical protein